MSYKIIEQYLAPNKYSRPQLPLKQIYAIVLHWVANPNTSAKANRDFFESRKGGLKDYGSAHEIIDLDGDVITCIPRNELAYHVGSSLPYKSGSKQVYTPNAWERLNTNLPRVVKPYPNNCTYGIEATHIDWDGKMTDETYEALVERCADLCIEFKLDPLTDIWLHQEVVGWKDCHRWFVNNPNEWKLFKEKVSNKIKNVKIEEGVTLVKVDKIRIASGTSKRIDGNYDIKGSDARVIKINPDEYDIEFVISKGKTVEQIAIVEDADFAINAPYFSGNQIIGYGKNGSGIISYDATGSKTNSWYGFGLKDGIPFIGAIYGNDIVDFAFKSSPFLVDNGNNVANKRIVIEQTAPDIKDAPKPRTALFLDENNHIIVTVVDGWTKKNLYKCDRGLYLNELADMGIGLGAKRGIGLDGGGSCSLYVKGQGLINALQDGSARVTGHALVFKKKVVKPETPMPITPTNDDLPSVQRKVKVIMNGEETESTGYLINDQTYLPLREITNALDGNIDNWDQKTYTVTISKK